MTRKEIGPAGGKENDESEGKKIGPPCSEPSSSNDGVPTERKTIDDAIRFDDIRDHASLMRYSDERVVEETHGPNGHQRRFTQRRTFHLRSTDWRFAAGIAGVGILCFVVWLLNKPGP